MPSLIPYLIFFLSPYFIIPSCKRYYPHLQEKKKDYLTEFSDAAILVSTFCSDLSIIWLAKYFRRKTSLAKQANKTLKE